MIEKLYRVSKKDLELTVVQITSSLLENSHLNEKSRENH